MLLCDLKLLRELTNKVLLLCDLPFEPGIRDLEIMGSYAIRLC